VVTTRADVHYVVTEYGVAYLHGKSIQERALALISIAHPDFRAKLLREAIEAKYLSASMADMEGKILVGPKELRTTYLLEDGTQINFRPIHPTDEPRMRDLFYALSQQTIYYRFMSFTKIIPRKQIQDFVYIDHRNDVTIVGTVPESFGEDIIAVGSYYLDPKTNMAEVAFVVRDDWQNRGIGTFLLRYLIRIARRNGIRGFTAEVLKENKAMQAVFNKSNCKLTTRFTGNVISYQMAFE
jgi:RimJ/RimL family protein N-acetyltransferase